jgi:hypothetical protein
LSRPSYHCHHEAYEVWEFHLMGSAAFTPCEAFLHSLSLSRSLVCDSIQHSIMNFWCHHSSRSLSWNSAPKVFCHQPCGWHKVPPEMTSGINTCFFFLCQFSE